MIPHPDAGELDLRDYVAVLRRRAALVAAVTVAVVVSALAVSFIQTPMYQGTTEVLLQARASEQIFGPQRQVAPAQNLVRVETEIEVMRSRSVREAVAEALAEAGVDGVDDAADVAALPVAIEAQGQTEVVEIRALDPDPETAATIADTYAESYIEVRREQLVDDLLSAAEPVQARIDQLDQEIAALDEPIADLDRRIAEAPTQAEREALQAERDRAVEEAAAARQALLTQRLQHTQQLDELRLASSITQTGGAQIVSRAEPPSSPVRPTPLRNAALALVVGGLLGVGAAFLVEYLDDSVKSKEELERATDGLTALALVPVVHTWKDRAASYLVSMREPASPAAEAYRSLRTSVQFLSLDKPLRLIQFTSPNPGEGKSTTLANLAIALARADQRVAVVCCDLRRPRVHEFFGLDNSVGFTSVLLGNASLDNALQHVPGEANVSLLASGPPPPNPSELLSSGRARETFDALASRFDVVLVDTPPVLPVTDAMIVSDLVDGTIVVATAKRSTRKDAHRTVELLRQVDAPLVGAVLNGVESEAMYGYGRYGRYAGYSSRLDVPKKEEAVIDVGSEPMRTDDEDRTDERPVQFPGSRR